MAPHSFTPFRTPRPQVAGSLARTVAGASCQRSNHRPVCPLGAAVHPLPRHPLELTETQVRAFLDHLAQTEESCRLRVHDLDPGRNRSLTKNEQTALPPPAGRYGILSD